jgi:hypothetical protein
MIISQSEPIVKAVTLKHIKEEFRGLALGALDRFTTGHYTTRESIFIYTGVL